MSEESKNGETLRIEISHFANNSNRTKASETNKEDINSNNLMKISIERKKNNNKASNYSYNVNLDKEGLNENGEKIKIKIENKHKKERKSEGNRLKSSNKTSENINHSLENHESINKELIRSINNGTKAVPAAVTTATRADVYGNIIKKGSKRHKVTFKDNIGHKKQNSFVKIVNVESYKSYNTDVSINVSTSRNGECSCLKKCMII